MMRYHLEEATGNPIDDLIAASEHKRRLESELKEVKKFIDDVAPVVREQFLQDGTQNVRRNNNTVFLRRSFKVKHKDGVTKPAVIHALKETGFDELTSETYSYPRLCATVKEMVENEEEVPPELQQFIEWKEEVQVIVKK